MATLSDLRWDAFLRLPKSQQAVGRKHMAALMALLELERNGASRNQAIAALRAQGAVPNRSTVFRWLKCVKGHPKIHWAQPYHDPAKARVVAGNTPFSLSWDQEDLFPGGGWAALHELLAKTRGGGCWQSTARQNSPVAQQTHGADRARPAWN